MSRPPSRSAVPPNASRQDDSPQAAPSDAATRSHDERRDSDREFRLLVDAVSEYAIFRLDPDGYVVSWNRGAEAIKGYDEDEIIGQHFSVFYAPKDTEANVPDDALQHAAQYGQWIDEGWRVRKNGDRFWAHVTITALYEEDQTDEGPNDESAICGFAKVTRDMTNRHNRSLELARARYEAEAERQRAERENALLQLMQTVTTTAHEAERLEDALQETIEAVCDHTGWPVGHAYRVERSAPPPDATDPSPDAQSERSIRFVSTDIWCLACPDEFEAFRRATASTVFPEGQGLPGYAAARGEPVWIRDVGDDPHFLRSVLAEELDVKGAFGMPVLHGDDPVAVLEFFSADAKEPDEHLMKAIGSVSVQLSRVAERVQAHEALRRSKERYQRLFETSQEAIVITAPDGTIVDANPAASALNGYARDELVGMKASMFYDEDDRRRIVHALRERGYVHDQEVHIRHRDGQKIICQVSATVWRDDTGEIEAIQSFARDVTEERRAQKALEESEVKFRTLAEESLVGIGMICNGVYEYVNQALADITGYKQDELIGQPPAKLFHPADRSFVEEQIQQRLDGEVDDAHYEANIVTKTGEERTLEIMGSRLIYQGRPAIIGMMQDITERKRAREALQESKEKFRTLAEQSPIGVLLIQNGAFKYANETLATMYGYERDEIISAMSILDLVHPEDRERVQHNIDVRLEGTRDTMNYRFRGHTREGDTIEVDAYGARIEYDGQPAILGTAVDITERVQLQREMLNMQEAERRRIGQDLHDGVASQLTGVGIMLATLNRRDGVTGETARQVEDIRQLIEESTQEIRRLSRGLAPAGLCGKNLVDALERLVDNIDGARFAAKVDAGKIPNDEVADHLYWIAQEAATNAQKHAEADTIVVRLGYRNDTLVLEVEDDGAGFSPNRAENGSFGLRTMRYRAELLGGTLTIDTAPGAGTHVTCRIPT